MSPIDCSSKNRLGKSVPVENVARMNLVEEFLRDGVMGNTGAFAFAGKSWDSCGR
jgi:hypothetical protein